MKARKAGNGAAAKTASFPNVFEKQTIFAAIAYIAITLIIFWPSALNPTHLVPAANLSIASYNARFDVYDSLWDLWWSNYAILGMHISPYFTSLLFYPMGANLSTQTLMPLSGIITAPLQGFGLGFAYNLLVISGFELSALFTYFLARYLIKERLPSFVAGVAFAFSAVNISHAYIFLDWTAIEWIPLFLLFFLLTVKTNKQKYILGGGLCFILINFMGTPEEGLMVAIFAAVLLYFGIFSGWKKEILKKKLLISLTEMVVIALIISSPLLIPLAQNAISSNALQSSTGSGIISNVAWSDSIASFFIPSQFNGIFTGISSAYPPEIGNYGFVWEGVSYIGYTIIILSIIAMYCDFKKRQLSNLLVWISLIIFFGWLSLGPLIKISGNYTSIPGIYLVYLLVPILNIVREPGRFDVFVSLCFALVSAFGLMYLLNNPILRGNWKKIAITSIVSVLILMECAGFPISQQFISQYYANTTISAGYSLIESAPNATVLVLPVQNGGQAMYYQTAFRKPILGGYTSRSTLFQQLYPYYIPIASLDSPAVPINNSLVQLDYPIAENYTLANLIMLSQYNISYIAVIKSSYNGSELSYVNSSIKAISGYLAYDDNSTAIYYIPKPDQIPANNTAFISGGLYPEEYVNGNSDPGVWWIEGIANITIYSTAAQNVTFCADLTSTVQGAVLSELNGNTMGSGVVYFGDNKYSTVFPLNKGYNALGFYSSNISLIETQNQSSATQIGFKQIRILYNDSSMQCN